MAPTSAEPRPPSAPPATPVSFKLGKRKRRTLTRPPPPPSAPAGDLFVDEVSVEEAREERAVEKIEEHLLRLFRQERVGVVRGPPPPANAPAGSAAPERKTAFKVKLLPGYFLLEGVPLALPYSAENQRFIQLLEQGRMPWDVLHSMPELLERCEGKFVEGSLRVDVEDKRMAEHSTELAVGSGIRQLTLWADDDALLQDLAEAELSAVMSGGDAWSREFKLKLESALLTHITPAPCLHPSLAVGRLTNMLQYNRLKLNERKLRCMQPTLTPIPTKKPRFGPAHYRNVSVTPQAEAPTELAVSAGPTGGRGQRRKTASAAAAAAQAASSKADADDFAMFEGALVGEGEKAGLTGGPRGDQGMGRTRHGKVPHASPGKGARSGAAESVDGGKGQGGSADHFRLLGQLAMRASHVQQQLHSQLAHSGEVFNRLAERALRMGAPAPSPSKTSDAEREAMARRIMPEHLLPRGVRPVDQKPTPVRTLSVPVGDQRDISGGHRHEIVISSADLTGRHALSLTITEGGKRAPFTITEGGEARDEHGAPVRDDSPFATIPFHVHGAKATNDFLRQWEKLQNQEQRSRARSASAAAAQSIGASQGGRDPGAHRAHALAAAASAAAAAAASATQPPPGIPPGIGGTASWQGQQRVVGGGAHGRAQTGVQRSGSISPRAAALAAGSLVPRPMIQTSDLGGLGMMVGPEDIGFGGLSSPMGLSAMSSSSFGRRTSPNAPIPAMPSSPMPPSPARQGSGGKPR